MKKYGTSHLVAGADLNHHGTLFAARAAAWFVEAAFVAASCTYGKNEIVCLNIQNMSFKRPVKPGTILNFEARVVLAGKTSFIVAVSAADALSGEKTIDGMLTFVTVDEQTGKKVEHQIILDEPEDEAEIQQRAAAEALKKK